MKDIQKLRRSTDSKYEGSLHVMESGIREIGVVKCRILGFGIRTTAQEIWSLTDNWSSTEKDCNPVPRIRNPGHGM